MSFHCVEQVSDVGEATMRSSFFYYLDLSAGRTQRDLYFMINEVDLYYTS